MQVLASPRGFTNHDSERKSLELDVNSSSRREHVLFRANELNECHQYGLSKTINVQRSVKSDNMCTYPSTQGSVNYAQYDHAPFQCKIDGSPRPRNLEGISKINPSKQAWSLVYGGKSRLGTGMTDSRSSKSPSITKTPLLRKGSAFQLPTHLDTFGMVISPDPRSWRRKHHQGTENYLAHDVYPVLSEIAREYAHDASGLKAHMDITSLPKAGMFLPTRLGSHFYMISLNSSVFED
jgi:hypothetical protein